MAMPVHMQKQALIQLAYFIAGLMLSLGAEGSLGFVVSHELVHGHHKMDRWLADVMLCTTGYMHWSVSHIAHHTQVSDLHSAASHVVLLPQA